MNLQQNAWLEFDKKWNLPPLPKAEAPIFLLAASWRCGSTLAQRLLCSSGEVLLWGEPYGDSGLIPNMVKSARVLLRDDWPAKDQFPEYVAPEQTEQLYKTAHNYWIANLYPLPEDIRASFRSQLDTLLLRPVGRHGVARFGLKEVRLDAECARFLQWIYPDARFIFLSRNPWASWRSYKGASWYYEWPDGKVDRAKDFAKIWQSNMESFLQWQADSSGLLVRYEDLITKQDTLRQVQQHCLLENIDSSVMTQRLRGMQKPPIEPTDQENKVIRRICGPLASQLGYHSITATDESYAMDTPRNE